MSAREKLQTKTPTKNIEDTATTITNKHIKKMYTWAKMPTKTPRRNIEDSATTITNKDIRKMNAGPIPWALKDLNDIVTIIRSMDTKHMNEKPSPNGHQTSKLRSNIMEILTIGITIKGIVVTIVKNIDMFLKIA